MNIHETALLSGIVILCAACLEPRDSGSSNQPIVSSASEDDDGAGASGADDADDPDGADDADGADDTDDARDPDDDSDDSDDEGDEDDEDCDCSGEADLPYNVNLPLGATFRMTDAFLQKGPLPAAVLELTMETPEWRLAELLANTSYVVTQADCDHEGNHGTGRDRANITWQNADGSTEEDHFTIRYCEDGGDSEGDDSDDEACDCGGGGGGGGEGEGGGTGVGGSSGAGGPECAVACSASAECGAGAACLQGCCQPVPN